MTKRIFALLLALLMVVALFAGCGEEKRSSKKDKSDKGNTAVTETAPSDPLQGAWTAEEDGIEMTFNFNGDGTGSIETMGINMDTTYTVSGDKISVTMTYMGESDTQEFEYSISGNELSLTADGETQVFTKNGTASGNATNNNAFNNNNNNNNNLSTSTDPLKGSWYVEEDGMETTFTFNGDGTGSIDMAGIPVDTTYTISGNKVSITMSFMGETETQELEYSINGNELTLTDGIDPIVFTKK